MMVFFQTRLGKTLIWQKLSQTFECVFKDSTVAQDIKAYLGPCLISMMEPFCKNRRRLKHVKYFCKKLHHRYLAGLYVSVLFWQQKYFMRNWRRMCLRQTQYKEGDQTITIFVFFIMSYVKKDLANYSKALKLYRKF